jgi:hypothetical protein
VHDAHCRCIPVIIHTPLHCHLFCSSATRLPIPLHLALRPPLALYQTTINPISIAIIPELIVQRRCAALRIGLVWPGSIPSCIARILLCHSCKYMIATSDAYTLVDIAERDLLDEKQSSFIAEHSYFLVLVKTLKATPEGMRAHDMPFP